MLSSERYKFIIDHTKGMALDAVWLYLEDDSETDEDRKDKFLWMLRCMVSDGIINFAKNGSAIAGDDAIARFKDAFPEDGENLDNGVWFFADQCPAGIGWVMPDGSIDWV